MNYVETFKPWLIKLLNQRIYCSKHGYSPALLTAALELKHLIEYNGYRHPDKLAGFILRKKELIKSLITKNNSYEKNLEILEIATKKAQIQKSNFTTTRTNSNYLQS